ARGGTTVASAAILGRFFDVNDAFRFGPCVHDAVVVTLRDASGARARGTYGLPGRALDRREIPFTVEVRRAPANNDATHWLLAIRSTRFAHAVTVDDDHHHTSGDGGSLVPGDEMIVSLYGAGDTPPRGALRALNGYPVPYGVMP
ncbi:MAG: hypothetical protein WCH83_14830, partial [Alphaproteobacteria bacterium]